MSSATLDNRESEVRSTASRAAEDLSETVKTIRSDLQNLSSKVSELANSGLSQARDTATEAVREVEDAVHRNPFTAVAVAVGLGFLLGILFRR